MRNRSAPSWTRATSAVTVGLGGAVLVAAGACARTGAVVEAPMLDADASATAVALVATGSAASGRSALEVPFKPGERWTGTYTCRQGATEMALVFEEVGGPPSSEDESVEVEAVLEFHFDGIGKAGYPAADGSARMRGKYEVKSRRLRLKGEEWIERPANYALVDLVGSVSGPRAGGTSGAGALTYSGMVEGPGCSSFTVRSEGADEPTEKAGGRPPPAGSFPRRRP